MTETVASPPCAKSVPRPRSRKPATVSASVLALHLDCSRTYIGKLEAEGVIQRQGDGFPLDQSRIAYGSESARKDEAPDARVPSSHGTKQGEVPRLSRLCASTCFLNPQGVVRPAHVVRRIPESLSSKKKLNWSDQSSGDISNLAASTNCCGTSEADGFAWSGQTYDSLSKVAFAITPG